MWRSREEIDFEGGEERGDEGQTEPCDADRNGKAILIERRRNEVLVVYEVINV